MYMPDGASGLALTSLEEGGISGVLLIGAAVGALIGGLLSDKYGRRHNITLLAILFFFGACGNAFSPNVWTHVHLPLHPGLCCGWCQCNCSLFT